MTEELLPPADLPEEAAELWRQAATMAPKADPRMLRGYVDAVLRYEEARKLYQHTSPVLNVDGSITANPLFAAVQAAAEQMRRFAHDLGIDRQMGMFDDGDAVTWMDRGAGGRATSKYTAARAEAVLTGIRMGNSRTRAALAAGITKDTLRNWSARIPRFARALEQAEAEGVAVLLDSIRQHAVSGAANTWQAAAWILERTHPDEFGQRNRVEISLEQRELVDKAAREAGLEPADVWAEVQHILAEATAK